jgi:hypothetical protein
VDCIVGYDPNILDIFSREVLKKIKDNDPLWKRMVPAPVALAIKVKGLFGCADHGINNCGATR